MRNVFEFWTPLLGISRWDGERFQELERMFSGHFRFLEDMRSEREIVKYSRASIQYAYTHANVIEFLRTGSHVAWAFPITAFAIVSWGLIVYSSLTVTISLPL